MINVLTIFGTRPEAIKLAPVIQALESDPDHFESRVCVTAQHREMLDQVMDQFGISADYDLDLMRKAQSPAEIAGTILQALPAVISETRPDIILVQGDTITAFAAAFAAYLNRVAVGHVEAGLRTGNFDHPFPEEMNRCLTSRIAELHFAPTNSARQALLKEGVRDSNIFVTGNTVIGALLATINPEHAFTSPELSVLRKDDPIILVTTHRRESFGRPLENICHAVRDIAVEYTDHHLVVPVHPNPNVREAVLGYLSNIPNVVLCEPLDYSDFVNLMARSRLVLTDSGGIQEEAPSLDVPVLVMRETTERPEGIECGAAKLVGTDSNSIVQATKHVLDSEKIYNEMAGATSPFGDGTSAGQIVDIISNKIGRSAKPI